jgi:hypothetical protein
MAPSVFTLGISYGITNYELQPIPRDSDMMRFGITFGITKVRNYELRFSQPVFLY